MTARLLSFQDYRQMAHELEVSGPLQERDFTVARYDNQELHAAVPQSLVGEEYLILGSISPPDQQMLSLLLLAHTLKQGEAAQVSAILPYLAYTRQDKVKAGESLATAWAGSLLAASGIDRIVTIDLHSERDKKLFPVPLISLSPAKLFATAIDKGGLMDATIVAADEGAIARCEAVKDAAGLPPGGTPYFKKKRTEQGVIHGDLIGKVGSRVIFIDDMLDTGGTLMSACRQLVDANVEEIYIFVTHGLFTGTRWKDLWSLRVKHIFCTDTVQPLRCNTEKRNITVLSVVPLLKESLSLAGWI